MEQKSENVKFILEEYRDLYQNVMHLENKLFNHLSFYTTLFLGIVTASIAILQLTPDRSTMSFNDTLGLLFLLNILLFVVGRFEIHMTTELRIRKMKFIEGITTIRAYFVELDDSVNKYLVLPIGLKKAPPYLRLGSQDWYQLIYLCFMNWISLITAWFTLPYFVIICWNIIFNKKDHLYILFVGIWTFIGLFLSVFYSWELSYKRIMDTCATYDKERIKRMDNPIEYDLLEVKMPENKIKYSISDWVRFFNSNRGRSHE